MQNRILLLSLLLSVSHSFVKAQDLSSTYSQYVEIKTFMNRAKNNEPYGILKMSRRDSIIKVKYFVGRSYNGTSVFELYDSWRHNKAIIAVTSGTYMDHCDIAISRPVGLCMEDGRIINKSLEPNMDGLIIVYATGGIATANLREGVNIREDNGNFKTLDIRDPIKRAEFISWAQQKQATIFQTHLFVYRDNLIIDSITANRRNNQTAPRRFLAVCREEDGTITYYVINLPTASTIYDGVVKTKEYLKNVENVNQIVFLINLDTGCQNLYQANDPSGNEINNKFFRGDVKVHDAINLLAFYF